MWDYIEPELNKEIQLKTRQNREIINGFNPSKNIGFFFRSGDVIRVTFGKGSIIYSFEGLCLAVRNRSITSKNTTFIFRNVLQRVGVEFIVSYYMNRLYNMEFNDFKRKHFHYNKSRLFYLRSRINRESKVL